MVDWTVIIGLDSQKLSVLALSSRFDGLLLALSRYRRGILSVLALSSRFDGHKLVYHVC